MSKYYERKPISTRTRFEVLKRDNFTCQYCGRKSPEVTLHIDHINPVANGGDNNILNLVTSCQDCNLGKSDKLLTKNELVEKQVENLRKIDTTHNDIQHLIEDRKQILQYQNEEIECIYDYFYYVMGVKRYYNPNSNVVNCNLRKAIDKYGLETIFITIENMKVYYNEQIINKEISSYQLLLKIFVFLKTRETADSKPYLKDIYYCRKILVNKSPCLNKNLAFEYLKDLYFNLFNKNFLELKDYCIGFENWEEFVKQYEEIKGINQPLIPNEY